MYNAIPIFDQLSEISISEDKCNGDRSKHMHRFIEIVYVTEGNGVHYINDVAYKVKRGDLLFMNYYQEHAFDKGSMQILNICIKPEFIDRELVDSKNAKEMLALSMFDSFANLEHISPVVSFTGKDLIEVEDIIRHIKDEWKEKDINYGTVVKGYVLILINKMFRQMRKEQLAPIVQHMNRITPDIILYIEEHCYEKINLTDLAQMCFYNPSYFSKIFKETFGKNLTDFIQEKRIEKAIELLKEPLSIEEIVQRVGFCDKKQFYKVFKKITGVTPGELR